MTSIREEIQFEHQIIVSRINMLLTIQGIIFGAYIGLDKQVYNQQIVRNLVDSLPWMGVFLLFFLQSAVCAGLGELYYLRGNYQTDRKKYLNKIADLAYVIVAPMILLAWLPTLNIGIFLNVVMFCALVAISCFIVKSTSED